MKPDLRLVKGGGKMLTQPAALPRSLDSYIEQFLEIKQVKKEWTVDFYRKGLKRYREFPSARFPPTVECLNEFVRYLQDQPGRGGKKMSPATIHSYLRAIETWCNWLVRQGVIKENPVEWVEAPRKPKQKIPRAPESDVVKELTSSLESQVEQVISRKKDTARYWRLIRDLCFLSLVTDTGMRVGEIERIYLEHIDFKRKVIYIPEAKDDEARDVVFGIKAKGDLNLWLKVRDRLGLPGNLPLFVSNHHGKWQMFTQAGIRQMLESRAKALGIKYYTPHAFRHFFASQALLNGGDLEFVSNQLGHASLTTTAIYTKMHLDDMIKTHSKSSPADNL